MKQDILTISRVMRILSGAEIECGGSFDDAMSMAILIQSINEKDISDKIYDVIIETEEERDANVIMGFFLNVHIQLLEFSKEIDKRKQHVIGLEIYVEDTEEERKKKLEDNEGFYVGDMYLSNYSTLKKAGLEPDRISLYECLVLIEEIACTDINKATTELLSMIDSDNPSFCEQVRKTIRYANFYSFALDIYNDVDEMYRSIKKKRDSERR